MSDPIIPDFDDNPRPTPVATDAPDEPSAAPTATSAPAATPSTPGQRKLVIICSKGNLDMAYPGLVLASAALGEGIETHMFFTFWGFDMITKGRMENLKFTMLGNTAMHLPMAPNMPVWAGMGWIPGMTNMATTMMKKQIADLDIPDVPEMIETIKGMGGHLWGCRMSFDMNGLAEEDLVDGIEGVISASDFMDISEGGQIIFI